MYTCFDGMETSNGKRGRYMVTGKWVEVGEGEAGEGVDNVLC